MKNSAYEKVSAARSQNKILTTTLVNQLLTNFFEIHGDRRYADDHAVIAGVGYLDKLPITVVGISKGDDTESNIDRHFGSPTPAGYHKALRAMEQAEKFNRPILALVNTPGAYPDVESEYHGQGSAVAQCIIRGLQLKVPYISIILGEGGSGGALALCCGDEVYMLENSIYSVLSPEGYASIMWKDSKKVAEAAEELGLTPEALLKEHVIEGILPEVESKTDVNNLKQFLNDRFKMLQDLSVTELLEQRNMRYEKF
ncbi:carboxyltransferase subunit alpha [Lentilactobacillus sp. SPB1-3]|uniref:Carboxyltransferase subunit alpha n=1 Tax=Lentilactobacillus terminaliae TaxID=3003483 RepID=A0ACD5DFV5_9LACO|nr:carboxyltransferase subunit alpha [Lentilactobacillus sp. SPB1-3]MCZ0976812.1 acetyl-CoA carboxylase carboxyl transferase subunit alpha [Lentilactobacillus sp. SPB1-3]